MNKFLLLTLKAVVVFSIGIVVLLLFLKFWMVHPSDKTLIQNFKDNETAFNNLIAMIQEDKGLERVDDNWTRPKNHAAIGLTEERIEKYRQIFKELRIPRGFYSFTNPVRIKLLASASGLSISGSAKGYAFLEEKPDLIVNDLEDYSSTDGESFTAYRHIEGKWYVFHDVED